MPENVVEDGPSAWSSPTHVGDIEEASGFGVAWIRLLVVMWGNELAEAWLSISLSLSMTLSNRWNNLRKRQGVNRSILASKYSRVSTISQKWVCMCVWVSLKHPQREMREVRPEYKSQIWWWILECPHYNAHNQFTLPVRNMPNVLPWSLDLGRSKLEEQSQTVFKAAFLLSFAKMTLPVKYRGHLPGKELIMKGIVLSMLYP